MLGIILVLAIMFSFANNISVIIFLASGGQIGIKVNHFLYTIQNQTRCCYPEAPVVAAVVYLWITVYSTFHQMKTNETGGARCTTSPSFSSSLVRHSQTTTASVQVKQQTEAMMISREIMQINLQEPSWTTGGPTTTTTTAAIEEGDVSQSSLISDSSFSTPNNSSSQVRG